MTEKNTWLFSPTPRGENPKHWWKIKLFDQNENIKKLCFQSPQLKNSWNLNAQPLQKFSTTHSGWFEISRFSGKESFDDSFDNNSPGQLQDVQAPCKAGTITFLITTILPFSYCRTGWDLNLGCNMGAFGPAFQVSASWMNDGRT